MASSETSLLNDRSAAKLRVNFGVRVLATVMSNRVQRMRRERRRKKERRGRGRELEMERDEKSCIETKVGRFRGLGTGMFVFVFRLRSKGRKVGRGGRLRFEGYDASRFIFTDYRTLDDCKLECNSSSASVDLSSVSGPLLSATNSFCVNECRASSFSVR